MGRFDPSTSFPTARELRERFTRRTGLSLGSSDLAFDVKGCDREIAAAIRTFGLRCWMRWVRMETRKQATDAGRTLLASEHRRANAAAAEKCAEHVLDASWTALEFEQTLGSATPELPFKATTRSQEASEIPPNIAIQGIVDWFLSVAARLPRPKKSRPEETAFYNLVAALRQVRDRRRRQRLSDESIAWCMAAKGVVPPSLLVLPESGQGETRIDIEKLVQRVRKALRRAAGWRPRRR